VSPRFIGRRVLDVFNSASDVAAGDGKGRSALRDLSYLASELSPLT